MKHLAPFAALCATVSWATTMVAADVPTLTQHADAIVIGTVHTSAPRLTTDGRRIITDTEIEVTEVLKGTPGKTVVVMQPGGIIGDVGQRIEGTAPFTAGENVVVFLERRGTDRWSVAGMIQGKFVIQNGYAIPAGATSGDLVDPATHKETQSPLSTQPLADLKAKILAALAAPTVAPATPGPTRIQTK